MAVILLKCGEDILITLVFFKKKTLVRLAIVSPIPSGALSVVRKETYRQNGQKDVEQTD